MGREGKIGVDSDEISQIWIGCFKNFVSGLHSDGVRIGHRRILLEWFWDQGCTASVWCSA